MVKFINSYGPHPDKGTLFVPTMDTCDQRAPVNDPQELFERYVVSPEIMDEMESESVDDFLDDIHPYDDRSDYGVDIAAAASKELADAAKSLTKRRKNSGRRVSNAETDN